MRLACSHAWANVSLCTTLLIWSEVKERMPFVIGTASAWSWGASAGGTMLRWESAVNACVVIPSTSMYWNTMLVRFVVIACWTAGSCANGATVST